MGRDLLAPGWSWETEGRARASRHQSFSARVHSNQSESSGGFSAAAFTGGLLERSAQSFNQKEVLEIQSLSQEADPEMFFSGVLQFGQRLQDRGKLELATEVYSAIVGASACGGRPHAGTDGCSLEGLHTASLQAGGHMGPPLQISEQAQKRLDAILGKGSAGLRAEVLIRGFADAATDYRMILPMIAGSVVGQTVRAATLSRFANSARATWLTRGLNARFAAGFAGYAAEVPVFAMSARLLAGPNGSTVSQDLQTAALTLGALKVFGYAGQQGFLKIHGFHELAVPTRLHGLARFNRVAIPQASLFLGLMGSHHLEAWAGLRPQVDGATTVTDTLATMVSLGVGSHLGHRVMGQKFAVFQGEMGLRADLDSKTRPRFEVDLLQMAPSLSGNPSRLPVVEPSLAGGLGMMMSQELKGGGKGGAKTLSERHRSLAAKHQVAPDVWLASFLKETGLEGLRSELQELGVKGPEELSPENYFKIYPLLDRLKIFKIKEGIPLLLEILSNADNSTSMSSGWKDRYRSLVAHALEPLARAGWIGESDAKILLPHLRGMVQDFLSDPKKYSHVTVALAIRILGAVRAQEAAPDLSRLLDLIPDNKNGVRSLSIWALGEMGVIQEIGRFKDLSSLPGPSNGGYDSIKAIGKLGGVHILRGLIHKKELSDSLPAILEALGEAGRPEAIPQIREFLKEGDPRVRLPAAIALARLGETAEAAAILLELAAGESDYRIMAIEALGELRISSAVSDLLRWLEDPLELDVEKRQLLRLYTAAVLVRLGVKGKPIDFLIDSLKEPQQSCCGVQHGMTFQSLDRYQVPIGALVDAGATEAVPVLRKFLQGPWRGRDKIEIAALAAEGLDRLQPDWDQELRRDARALLGAIQAGEFIASPKGKEELDPALELKGSEETTRWLTQRAQKQGVNLEFFLGKIFQGASPREVEEILGQVSWSLLEKMKWIGDYQVQGGIRLVRETLKASLSGSLPEIASSIRDDAIEALLKIGTKGDAELWVTLLSSPEPSLRLSAAKGLVKSVEKSVSRKKQLVSVLTELTDSSEGWISIPAAELLGEMGDREKALIVLREWIRAEDLAAQAQAATALARFEREEAIQVLLRFTRAPLIFLEGAIALGQLGEKKHVLPIFQDFLLNPQGGFRGRAALALAELGAAEAIPHLLSLLKGEVDIPELSMSVRQYKNGKEVEEADDRYPVALALTQLGQDEIARPILQGVLKKFPEESLEIAEVMDRIQPAWWVNLIQRIQSDGNRIKTLKIVP